jgi:hypothetical protein
MSVTFPSCFQETKLPNGGSERGGTSESETPSSQQIVRHITNVSKPSIHHRLQPNAQPKMNFLHCSSHEWLRMKSVIQLDLQQEQVVLVEENELDEEDELRAETVVQYAHAHAQRRSLCKTCGLVTDGHPTSCECCGSILHWQCANECQTCEGQFCDECYYTHICRTDHSDHLQLFFSGSTFAPRPLAEMAPKVSVMKRPARVSLGPDEDSDPGEIAEDPWVHIQVAGPQLLWAFS